MAHPLHDVCSEAVFSRVRSFYEQAVSNLDPYRSIHRPVQVTHSWFIEGSHTTKNTASENIHLKHKGH